jgi:hypothetical protein
MMCIANRQLDRKFRKNRRGGQGGYPGDWLAGRSTRSFTAYELLPNCCVASVNYATILNYSAMELRYMDAGE